MSKSTTHSLSDLPNPIIQWIFCQLPSKDAVAMSVLSKQCKYLWRSTPRIELQERQFRSQAHFVNFVDRFFHLYDKDSNIESFSLSCWVRTGLDASRVDEWIAFAVEQGVEEVDLSFWMEQTHVFPRRSSVCLFQCANLRKLRLRFKGYDRGVLRVPAEFHVPYLEELILEGVKFDRGEPAWKLLSSPSLQRLSFDFPYRNQLPSCIFYSKTLRKLHIRMPRVLRVPPQVGLPLLDELILKDVVFRGDEPTLTLLSSPSLKSLSVYNCCWDELRGTEITAPMLRDFSCYSPDGWLSDSDINSLGQPSIVINGPSLLRFCLSGKLKERFVISGPPSLDNAEIRVTDIASVWDAFPNSKHIITELFESVLSVKSLVLCSYIVQDDEIDPFDDIPSFLGLTTLMFSGDKSISLDKKPLVSLIHRCPCLKILEFNESCRIHIMETDSRPDHNFAFLENLQKIIHYFYETEEEIAALKLLLERAVALEEVVLYYEDIWYKQEIEPHDEHYFSKLPRASESCRFHCISAQNKKETYNIRSYINGLLEKAN